MSERLDELRNIPLNQIQPGDIAWLLAEVERLQTGRQMDTEASTDIIGELEAQNAQLREALEKTQWEELGYESKCRGCGRTNLQECDPDCYISLALKGASQ